MEVIHRHDRARGDDGDWQGLEGTGELDAAPSTLHFVVPGEPIAAEAGFLRGHNTYMAEAADGAGAAVLTSSVCGAVERVNKLVCARPVRSRYFPEVGDVVVGRVVEVAPSQRWRVEICARCVATLALAAVNLPGGVQRRRTEEDALHMRAILKEGDLITAEVQSLSSDNVPLLHTRSSRYGKLTQGVCCCCRCFLCCCFHSSFTFIILCVFLRHFFFQTDFGDSSISTGQTVQEPFPQHRTWCFLCVWRERRCVDLPVCTRCRRWAHRRRRCCCCASDHAADFG